MRGRAQLPGGRAGRDAGAVAEPLGLALLQPPAASSHRARAPGHPAQTKLSDRSRSPQAPLRPHSKRKREPFLPGLVSFNLRLPGEKRSRRRGPAGHPLHPGLLRDRGGAEGKRHLNPQAAGGACLGQTRRRSDPGTPRPPARRSPKRSSRQVALKCIPLPSNRRGGEGEKEKERGASDRQGERGGRTQCAPGRRLGSGRHCLCGPRPLPRPAQPHHTHPSQKPGRPPAPLSTSAPQKRQAALQDVLPGRRPGNRAGLEHPTPTRPTPRRGASC